MAVEITLQQLRNVIPTAPENILTEILQSVNSFRNQHNIASISTTEIRQDIVGVYHSDAVSGQASIWIQRNLNTLSTAGDTTGGGRCCFNSTFCKGTTHYKKKKPVGYKSKHDLAKQAVTPPYKSVAKLRRGGKKNSLNEDDKEEIRINLAGLTKEEQIANLEGVLRDLKKKRLKRKKGSQDAEPSSIIPSLPPPPPPSAPMIAVGGARTAKTAQQHAMEAIAQIQALLGVVAPVEGPLDPRHARLAMKDLGKAKYKQTKYEKEEKKDVAYKAKNLVERPRKAESPWITHVKTFAKHYGMSYKQALTDAGPSYHKPKPAVPPPPR